MFYGGILLLLTTGFAYAVVDYTGYEYVSFLSYAVASGTVSDIAPCIEIVNPLVVYIFW